MKSQNGLALLVTLVVLVVSILFGVSSYQAYFVEERMAGNHRFSVSALQAAEGGVKEIVDTIFSYEYEVGDSDILCDGIDDLESYWPSLVAGNPYSFSNDGGLVRKYWVKVECGFSSSGESRVIGYSRGVVLDGDEVELAARIVRLEAVPPGWTTIKGMIADDDITIRGNSTVVGVIHANGDLYIRIGDDGEAGEPIGYVTASGEVKLDNKVVDPSSNGVCDTLVCASSGVAQVEVPTAFNEIRNVLEAVDFAYTGSDGDAVNTDFFDMVQNNPDLLPFEGMAVSANGVGVNNFYLLPSQMKNVKGTMTRVCEVDLDGLAGSGVGLGEGESLRTVAGDEFGFPVFYCPGNLTVTDDFHGGAIMASGDIIHNGSSSLGTDATGGEAVDTFVYATGSISLNGSTETYGQYLSDGNFTQNGTSKIYGTIVAGGDIFANGGIDFEAMDTGKIKYLASGRLDFWDELESSDGSGMF